MKRVRAWPFLRDPNGATAVEFALIIGPIMLLFVATIEIGRMVWVGHALDQVASSAARCVGIRAQTCATGTEFTHSKANDFIVQAALSWGVEFSAANISFDATSGCAVDTGFARVALSYSFDSILPGLDGALLTAEACFPNQM